VPRQPWRATTGPLRHCITISGEGQSIGTRYGRCCIISIVALGMARRPPRAFSGGHFRISLKQLYPTLRPCLNRGGENAKLHYAIEVIGRPALSGYPNFPLVFGACRAHRTLVGISTPFLYQGQRSVNGFERVKVYSPSCRISIYKVCRSYWIPGSYAPSIVRKAQLLFKAIEKEGLQGGKGDNNWVVRHRQIPRPWNPTRARYVCPER